MDKPVRIIARCDIKNTKLIKGIAYEGVRVIGDVSNYSIDYYKAGADEICYLDTVATLYNRSSLIDLVDDAVRSVHVPISVGGGIADIETARKVLGRGAEKIIVNTAAQNRPELITELSAEFGSQCVCVSIQAKKKASEWVCMTTYGREEGAHNLFDWIDVLQKAGAGEILLSSVDFDGKMKGMDIELISEVIPHCTVPLIASSGFVSADQLLKADCFIKKISGIAVGSALHYNRTTIGEIKTILHNSGVAVRLG